MIDVYATDVEYSRATDGEIAVINLNSARQQAWSRFWQSPQRAGIAEYIVEQEQLTLQFLGDVDALERLETLIDRIIRMDLEPGRIAIIRARVASTAHRFAEARSYLQTAELHGQFAAAKEHLLLSIDQADGTNLDRVLDSRRQLAAESGRLEDWVALGSLLADLREFEAADRIYQRGLKEYQGVSPFALAWACFQLGSLWGELVPEPRPSQAALWYEKAIEYLPSYVKARVHLSEICVRDGRVEDAADLLLPVVSSGDPEVCWRLADVMTALGRHGEASVQIQAARSAFETLLAKYQLAFADHGAEFYSGSGSDFTRALELTRANVANRPTLRAFEQAYEIATAAGETRVAAQLLADGARLWRNTAAFKLSRLAACETESSKRMPDRSPAAPVSNETRNIRLS
jgi:tetratricopeptide (TPR) repeat protein